MSVRSDRVSTFVVDIDYFSFVINPQSKGFGTFGTF